MELTRYILYGCATTVVNWSVYTAGVKILQLEPTIANVMAWVIAVLFAFTVNKKYVFLSKLWTAAVVGREFVLFVSARLFSGVIEMVGLPFLLWLGVTQSLFGVEGSVAKLSVTVIVVILNYLFSKFVVFKKEKR